MASTGLHLSRSPAANAQVRAGRLRYRWAGLGLVRSIPLMELAQLQDLMASTYGERDQARGIPATVAWLAEEFGELAQAVRKGSREQQLHEFSDVLAWLASLANQLDISLDEAAGRFAGGCPKCGNAPCRC